MRRKRNKLKALRPKVAGWRKVGILKEKTKQSTATTIWMCGALQVLVDAAIYRSEADGKLNPQHQISVSRRSAFTGRPLRPSDAQLQRVLDAFVPEGMWWEEDNHHPGNARHVFIPLYASQRMECPCKDEEVIVEPDGYTYSYDGSYDQERMAKLLGNPSEEQP